MRTCPFVIVAVGLFTQLPRYPYKLYAATH
jgi:hypothetical protein